MIDRIETERLILRKAEERDLDLIWNRVWRDERLAAMMLWTPTLTREEAEARMARTVAYQRDNYAYFICLKATDEPIGFGGIICHAGCFQENLASAATIRSCGFAYVSSHKEVRERDGYEYLCDCYELRR